MSRLWLLATMVAAYLAAACTVGDDGGGSPLSVEIDESQDIDLDREAGTVGGPSGPVGPDAW